MLDSDRGGSLSFTELQQGLRKVCLDSDGRVEACVMKDTEL